MDVHATEEEQIEAIKKWWRDNWKALFGGILLGLGLLYGGRAWFQQKDNYAASASVEFEAMVQAAGSDKKTEAGEFAAKLLGQYTDTPYAVMASFAMAKIKVEEKDLQTAKIHLRWALEHTTRPAFKHIARLRLARVMLAEGGLDEALSQLSNLDTGTYTSSYEELKGDIYLSKGDVDLARTAYKLALVSMDTSSRGREIVEMKLDDLGESPVPTSAS
ncbi:MAG: YfgM family protein [Thiohalomonadales bacterium]